jgi:MSHA pilin protein MshC
MAERLPRSNNIHALGRKCAQLGFTLVELVTVIAIMGVLVAFAAPRFVSQRPFADRGYADELAAALRNAQKIAVGSGCWVSVDVTPASYQALQRPDPSNCNSLGPWTMPVVRTDGTLVAGQPPQGVTVVGSSQFIFNGAGTLEAAAGNVQIGPYTVAVVAATGLVTVN